MKYILFICVLSVASISAIAQNRYVDGIQKVTFRTGPGTDNKIIKMVETNQKLTLIEEGEKWSKVKDSDGDEGYILNRFLTKDVPATLKYEYQKNQNKKLTEKNDELNETINKLKQELAASQTELTTTKTKLDKTQSNFTELKEGASDYIGLKERYDNTVIELERQTERVSQLEAQVNTYYIKWFLAGGGVLFLGWLIGLISRKKKYQSGIRL